MDVTALLNASLVLHDPPTPRSFDQSPTPSVEIDGTTAPSTVVSTPPAKSTSLSPLSRRGSDSSSSPTSRVAPPLSTSSSRSRTPWDAGGYSLPLAVDTRSKLLTMDDAASTDRPPQTAIFSGDSSPTSRNYQQLQLQQHQPQVHSFAHHHTLSSAASPQQSPRHKFSDSHSSMSSYTTSAGSADSVSHSRISSMSTISGIQPLSGSRDNAGSISIVTTDVSLLAVDDDMDQGDSAASSKTPLPPCKLLDRADLSSVGQSHQQDQQLFSPRSAAERPSSPSDAMLIARGGGARVSPQDQTSPYFKPPLAHLLPPAELSPSKSHKRAVSAPDIPLISANPVHKPSFGPIPEPTPPSSQQGESCSTASMEPINTAPALPGEEQTEPIVCMYMENCDTGSQLRKAISHIFGRNKLCTRQIPAHVWVHYCRKHYQRSRYRNAQDYSKLQIELVQKQIQRVQEWSDANKAAGRDGVVTDWSLAIRKREQKRLEDQVSKKRPFRATADDSDDDAGDFGGGKNRNPVPDWLLEKCGTGYSTEEIERIVGLLRDKIVSGQLSQIPDIEILPTITSDPVDENNRPKAYHKRKSSAVTAAAVAAAATHKRSHSINVGALRSEAAPIMIRRVSQPSFWTGGEQSPEQKRQRTSSSEFGSSDYYHDDQQRQTLPPFGMRRMHQLPHRPAFGNIRESQSEDVYNHQQQPLPSFLQQRSHSYSAASGSPGGPGPLLPAPIPQRYGTGLADQLESQQHASCGYSSGGSGGYDQQQRRPAHQRSHSEVGSFSFNFGSSSSGYRPSSSSGFQPINGPPPPPPPPPPASYSSGPLPRLENPFASTTPTSSAPYGSSAATATNNSLHVRRLSHQGPDYSPPTNYPAQQHHLNPPSTAASGFGATRHARHQSSPSVPRLHQLQQHHYGSVPGTSGSVMTTAATAPTLPPISSYGSGNNNSSGFSFRPRSPLEPALSPFDQSRHNHHHHHHSTSSVSSITSNHHQQHSRRPSYAAAGGHGQAGAYPPPSVAEEEDGCCEDPPQQQQQQRDVVMLPPLQPQGQIQEL